MKLTFSPIIAVIWAVALVCAWAQHWNSTAAERSDEAFMLAPSAAYQLDALWVDVSISGKLVPLVVPGKLVVRGDDETFSRFIAPRLVRDMPIVIVCDAGCQSSLILAKKWALEYQNKNTKALEGGTSAIKQYIEKAKSYEG